MNEITRRAFGTLAAFSPFAGLLGEKKKKPSKTDIRVKRWYRTARYYSDQSVYWRERCLAAEKDLGDREDAMFQSLDMVVEQYKELWEVETRDFKSAYEKSVKIWNLLDKECSRDFTHPDCLKNPDEDIRMGRTKSFSTVSEMLESLKETA